MSFADMKRNAQANLEKLTSELEKLSNPGNNNDDQNTWYPSVDKAGNGYAVIRFLPAPSGEDVPFVRLWSHGFKGPGGWYIDNSLTTIGKPDPVSEHNTELWNSGIEANKKIVSGFGKDNPGSKRQLNYYSNILVISDPANPANEGKVFLYKYGAKIFEKVKDAMNPQFPGETPINPFDFWVGANFQLKIRQVEGYRNYDKSEFDKPAPLFNDDAELETVWARQYSLADLIAPAKFKSYDELKSKLQKVLGNTVGLAPRSDASWDNMSLTTAAPSFKAASAPALATALVGADSDDEDIDFFKRLAEED